MSMSPRLLRPRDTAFSPRSIPGLALWLDASSSDLYTTDAGPVVAVTDPRDIAGCVGWWDASDASTLFAADTGTTLATTTVGRWADKSTAAIDLIQPTSGSRPTATAAAVNGRSALTFDGTDFLSAATSVALGDNTVIMVVREDVAVAYSGLFAYYPATGNDNSNANGWVADLQLSDNIITLNSGASSATWTGVTTLPLSVVTLRRQIAAGDRQMIRANGVTQAVNASASTGTAAGILIGGRFQSGAVDTLYRARITLCEVVRWDRALSAAEYARVEAYLATKWGISGVHTPATASSDPVGYWGDKSGNGRHAVQATAGSRPAISATTQNGRRVLAFDGSDDHLAGAVPTSALPVFGMGVLFFPSRKNIGVVYEHFTGATDNVIFYRGHSSTDGFRITNDTNLSSTALPADNQWQLMGFLAGTTTSNSQLYFNGTINVTGNAGTLTPQAGGYYLARWASAGASPAYTPMRMGEWISLNRAPTTVERQKIERYLAAKWGITLAPQVSNLDAQDWINRVYANGGTVSSATAASVNTLCESLDAASLRDRFYRLNLFCGTGLNAALVPLYRGPSLGGTQYGNTTDTNEGGLFVTANYNETGASGGLQGASASSKRLRTGLAQDAMPTGDLHIAAYEIAKSNASSDTSIGARNNLLGQYSELAMGGNTTTALFYNVGTGFATASDSGYTQAGGFLLGVSVSTALTLYKNGSSAATGTVSAAASTSSTFAVFSTETELGTGADYTNARLGGYSIGLSMDAPQAAAYNTAMQSFQAALTRNV